MSSSWYFHRFATHGTHSLLSINSKGISGNLGPDRNPRQGRPADRGLPPGQRSPQRQAPMPLPIGRKHPLPDLLPQNNHHGQSGRAGAGTSCAQAPDQCSQSGSIPGPPTDSIAVLTGVTCHRVRAPLEGLVANEEAEDAQKGSHLSTSCRPQWHGLPVVSFHKLVQSEER